MTEHFSTKKLVLSTSFTALACMVTISTRIPTPGTSGYIYPGDAIVALCGVFLDPISAFLTAGVGSCMADPSGGYLIYVPITLVIKGLVAFSASHVCGRLRVRGMNPYVAVADCGVIDITLVARGYCLCEIFLYGLGAALANVPSNIIQEISGLVISSTLYPVLRKLLSMVLKAQTAFCIRTTSYTCTAPCI